MSTASLKVATEMVLLSAGVHVGYEVRMLGAAAGRLENGESRPVVYDHALLETVLLHARNLTEFLLHSKASGLIHRSHFAPGWAAPSSPQRQRLVTSVWDKVSVLLLHLHWERVDGFDAWVYPTDYPELVDDLFHVFGQFVNELEARGSTTTDLLRNDLAIARKDRLDAQQLSPRSRGFTTASGTSPTSEFLFRTNG